MDRKSILERVKDKEFIKRCVAVDICPVCGQDLKNISKSKSSWVAMACTDRTCHDYYVVRNRFRP